VVAKRFDALFSPKVIAIAGLSGSGKGQGNQFLSYLRDYGYSGRLYAVHPSADHLHGIDAFPSLADVPEKIDYAYIAVPGPAVPQLLRDAGGNVAFAQVMSSGFGETADGEEREDDLVEAARCGGVRMIGPNCLGTFSPRGRLTFVSDTPVESGPVGVVSQSGGLGVDIIRRGKARGIRFSGLVTVGNSADVNASDVLEFYLGDDDTEVIGLYLEGIADGRRLFELLSMVKGIKPVVLLKGGRTPLGQRAAASHTGSVVTDDRLWTALCRQTGVLMVDTLEEFLHSLLALQMLTPLRGRSTRNVVLFGNGGGTSVLASDVFYRAGFDLPTLGPAGRQALEDLQLPPGTSFVNPVDTPAGALMVRRGRIISDIVNIVVSEESADAVVIHVNLAVLSRSSEIGDVVLASLVETVVELRATEGKGVHMVLVLRSDGETETEDWRRELMTKAHEAFIPVYGELTDAAQGLLALRNFEEARTSDRSATLKRSDTTFEPHSRTLDYLVGGRTFEPDKHYGT
jgi:acyl-CoA synthetase (NDP forming)